MEAIYQISKGNGLASVSLFLFPLVNKYKPSKGKVCFSMNYE